eukprot:188955-Pyramimonas_sp.AAC.1
MSQDRRAKGRDWERGKGVAKSAACNWFRPRRGAHSSMHGRLRRREVPGKSVPWADCYPPLLPLPDPSPERMGRRQRRRRLRNSALSCSGSATPTTTAAT